MNFLYTNARDKRRVALFKRWLLSMSLVSLFGVLSAADLPRQRQLIDSGWRFRLGDPADLSNPSETNVAYYPEIAYLPKLQSSEVSGTGSETYLQTVRADPVATHLGENVSAVQTNFNDSAWRLLNLPHDWVVELPFDSNAAENHGYKSGINDFSTSTNAVGWYRRTFTLSTNYAGQTMWLEFDGVYRNCLVWLNGHILGRNVSGYSSFSFDISQYANPGGTNVLVLRVDATRFEGWFYEGAGIYRHVWLVNTAPVHVAHWGTYVSSVVAGTNATVTAQTQVNNDSTNSAAVCDVISTILDSNSNVVASATQSLTIGAGTNLIISQALQMTNAQLWSLSSPRLYQLISTVTQSGATNDIYQTRFGIRTIRFDPNQGLFLNGQRVEIQGMCNHQDHAGVGSALPERLQYFRVERLKEMGCNVCRTSHNPPTPEFLNACDQLGMLVLDENRRPGTNTEELSELQRLIVRDRNHPSVFCWSMANEEDLQRDGTVGAPIMQKMVNLVHQLDPSRKCTAAMNSYSSGSADGFSTALDVQGFNYMNNGDVDGFHSGNPNMASFGTEEASTVFTRGIYANTSTYLSAYDLNVPGGYAATAEAWWQYYLQRRWNGGACVWTGFDYRGEPSPFGWPDISSEFGVVDTCGFPKDVFYYYQANWTFKPVLHLLPHWNWSAGQSFNIWVFGNCQVVELFTNGVSLGRQPLNVQSHVEWDSVSSSSHRL
jgi:beta-galactosidase